MGEVPIFISYRKTNRVNIEERLGMAFCETFLKAYRPFLLIIKGSAVYPLIRDVEELRYKLEDMLDSGQIDDHTILVKEASKKIRLECAERLKNNGYHSNTNKRFQFEFDFNGENFCYKCKEDKPNEDFISSFQKKLASSCYQCRGQPKRSILRLPCRFCK